VNSSLSDSLLDEVHDLALACLGGEASPQDVARLDELLLHNEVARQIYAHVIRDSINLRRWALAEQTHAGEISNDHDSDTEFLRLGIPDADLADFIAVTSSDSVSGNEHRDAYLGAATPLLGLLDSAIHSHSFQSWSLAYLTATVLLGVGLLIGSWISITHRELVAKNSQPSIPFAPDAKTEQVGQITGMVDCRWTDPKTKVFGGDYVRLGQEYALAEGYLEITYDTGASVILQGPCTYQVESISSGFLSLGKLTARVESRESRVESKVAKQEPSRLSALNSRLFSVRTPTALVTDLGTEFGVEVDSSGATRSHVFRGRIELRCSSNRELATGGMLILQAGQSARVADKAHGPVPIREAGQGDRFAQRMPSAVAGTRRLSVPDSAKSARGAFHAPYAHGYRMTDLGTLGGPESRAISINAAGAVVGFSITASGDQHAFLYRDGVMTDLHPSARSSISMASAVNNRGLVAGDYMLDDDKTCRAFLYSDGKTTDLGTLHGSDSFVRGMNNRGQVVGFCTDRKTGRSRAFLWSDGKMTDLGAVGTDSYAHDVNADGLVVGYCATAGKNTNRAFLYRPGVGMKDLGTLGGRVSIAMRINNLGQIVGNSATAEAGDGVRMGFRAFLYDPGGADSPTRPGKMIDLGSLGGYASTAFGINGKGQIVGDAVDAHHVIHAFLRQPDGTMIDLNAAVDPALGWTLSNARAINDAGQIAGFGTDGDGNNRAFLLTPQPPDPQRKEGAPMM
jgi:probable HAF family extracellular repeat protein